MREAVIFEDRDVLVLGKLQGLLPMGERVRFGALEALGPGRKRQRWLTAHRLDRDTSGVLLLAKRRAALRHLQQAFRGHGPKALSGGGCRELACASTAQAGECWPATRRFVRCLSRETRADWGFGGRATAGATLLALTPETGVRTNYGCTCPMRFPIQGTRSMRRRGTMALGRCPCRGWRFMPKR